MAQSFTDGGTHIALFAWGGESAMPSVVNKEGRTAPGWSRQRTLLEEEGVHFKPNGHVDMQRHLWEPKIC